MSFWRKRSRPRQLVATAVVLGEDSRWPAARLDVVGESFHQDAISAVSGRRGAEALSFDCVAVLVPEERNPHDPLAIAVQVDGRVVGHLGRQDARLYHPVVDAALELQVVVACNARIAARDPDEAATTNAGVFLHLPSPGDCLAELTDWSTRAPR